MGRRAANAHHRDHPKMLVVTIHLGFTAALVLLHANPSVFKYNTVRPKDIAQLAKHYFAVVSK